jgi:hypothetical protein
MYYVQNKNFKIRSKLYNEKYLVLLLLILSIVTIFFILLNLPSDIQRVVNTENLHNVFVPELNSDKLHQFYHQHPMPPLHKDDGETLRKKLETNSPQASLAIPKTLTKLDQNDSENTKRREKIKEVI